MPVIAVVNRKGGSGKSTLATHLATYCALTGKKVMLGDVDRQQSAQTFLRLRGNQKLPAQAAVQGWALDPKNVLRAPAGVTHMVLDTPGGMRGFELARIVMAADVILMPVCNSVFDRESAAECFAELKAMPRVASGRCKVAAIGMRLDSRTKAGEVLADWAQKLDLPFLGVLRETQAYVRCIELGLTLFDLPRSQVQADLVQWKPVLAWVEDALRAPDAAPATKSPAAQAAEAPARPVPQQILASPPAAQVDRPATLQVPRTPARVERAPEGELAHAGTLASIGELARALKANEANAAAERGGAGARPARDGRDAAVEPAVTLRPTRPIVPSSRPPAAPNASRAASASNTAAASTNASPASSPVTSPSSPSALQPSAPVRAKPAQPATARDNGAAPAWPTSKGNGAPQPGNAPAKPSSSSASRAASTPRPATSTASPARPATLGSRIGQLLDTLPIPRFLQRNS